MQKRVAFTTVAVALLIAASPILWRWPGSDIAANSESSGILPASPSARPRPARRSVAKWLPYSATWTVTTILMQWML